jgi:hypothetical protein
MCKIYARCVFLFRKEKLGCEIYVRASYMRVNMVKFISAERLGTERYIKTLSMQKKRQLE